MARRASILGTGSAGGDERWTSAALDARHGLPPGHLERVTGVRARAFCRARDQIDLAADASHAALAQAGWEPGTLDAIVFTAAVGYQAIPCTAPLVQRALGVPDGRLAAFDVDATCLGFLAALDLAAAAVETGRWERVLIVASERASRGLDWTRPEVAGLFGDGAAAAALGASSDGRGVVAAAMETHPSAYEASALVAGGTRLDPAEEGEAHRRFAMDGPALFALTRRHLGPFTERLLAAAGWSAEDVDRVVPHQASPLALAHMARALPFRAEAIVDISREVGNQVAASLPTALDHARRSGLAPPGARLLLLGTAAGVSLGGAAVIA